MCLDCGRQFVGGYKPTEEDIITDYIDNKMTLRQLSEKYSLSDTALSFKIELKYSKDVYFIAKMPNFAHSDAEAPPSVFLYHMNKIF